MNEEIKTLADFFRAGGLASTRKQQAGMTKEQISERMRWIRSHGKLLNKDKARENNENQV
jgi:hypothetical protein